MKDRKPAPAVLLALIAVLLAAAPLAGRQEPEKQEEDTVVLRYTLEKGSVFHVRITMVQDLVQEIMGTGMEMKQAVGMEADMSVRDVDADGNHVADCLYTRCTFAQKGGSIDMEYDSDDPPDTVPSQALGFAALVNSGFSMTMAPSGKIVKLEGVDRMVEKMIDTIVKEDPTTDRDSLLKVMEQQFGEQAMMEEMSRNWDIYPKNPVAVGDTWEKKITVSKGFPMILENKYKLASFGDGVAEVEVASVISPNPDPGPSGPVEMKISVKGTQTGTISIDLSTGVQKKTSIKQLFSGTVEVGGAGGMSIPIKADGTVEIGMRRSEPEKKEEATEEEPKEEPEKKPEEKPKLRKDYSGRKDYSDK
ncbi:MAG: DUF6263 family protein [Planctomycetota bacterium]|jgi:hypothetical protein